MQIRIKFRRARQTYVIIENTERTRALSRHHFRSRFAAQHQIDTLSIPDPCPVLTSCRSGSITARPNRGLHPSYAD